MVQGELVPRFHEFVLGDIMTASAAQTLVEDAYKAYCKAKNLPYNVPKPKSDFTRGGRGGRGRGRGQGNGYRSHFGQRGAGRYQHGQASYSTSLNELQQLLDAHKNKKQNSGPSPGGGHSRPRGRARGNKGGPKKP